jgi:hypothetical protein
MFIRRIEKGCPRRGSLSCLSESFYVASKECNETKNHQNKQFTYADPPPKNDRTYADPPGGGFRISRFLRSKSTELEPDIY